MEISELTFFLILYFHVLSIHSTFKKIKIKYHVSGAIDFNLFTGNCRCLWFSVISWDLFVILKNPSKTPKST